MLESRIESVIHFGFVTFLVHEIMWMLLTLPYLLIEKYELFQHYKIQKNTKNSYDEFKTKYVKQLKEQFSTLLPTLVVLSFLLDFRTLFFMYWESLPRLPILIVQFIAMRMIQELGFYWAHRWLHTPWAYQNIHKIHHDELSPCILSSEHAHPLEGILCGTLPIALAIVMVALSPMGKIHVFQFYGLLFYTLISSLEGHSGYLLPWHIDNYSLFSWINGGSVHHDAHHLGFHYNFGEKWIDKIFGTDMQTIRNSKHA